MTLAARYRAVGNGVHILVARALALATRSLVEPESVRLCLCGCARVLSGRRILATAACRKRMQRRRDSAGNVTARAVTLAGASHFPVPELVTRAPGRSQFEVAA